MGRALPGPKRGGAAGASAGAAIAASRCIVVALALTNGCAARGASGTFFARSPESARAHLRVDAQPAAKPARAGGNASAATSLRAVDPTVVGARVVPESVDDLRLYGVEAGGGVRGIAGGVRLVSLPFGAMQAAIDRLPQPPKATAMLPERLGGGFLYVLGNTVWRADQWLSPISPIFTSPNEIVRIFVGLDRVYVRGDRGTHQAIDPRTGARLDVGPWPGSSVVGAYAAADGWRAVAVNDLRGVVATFDAGATWKPLGLPIDATSVDLVGDLLVVTGEDTTHAKVAYEVRPDGQVGRAAESVQSAPTAVTTSASFSAGSTSANLDGLRTFGKRPLTAAVEDGFPLGDGTAIVARDGSLGRVRLDDGALVDVARDAYALKPSRCHAMRFDTRVASSVSTFGFVCGEPRGQTAIYAYDEASGALVDVKRFDTPRAVLAAGNGALAVHGPCAESALAEEDGAERSYCVLGALASGPMASAWRDVRVRGTNGGERVVPLADGRVAVITPPEGVLAAARLTILDHGTAQTRSLDLSALVVDPDVTRIVRNGAWLDGFEERTSGVLSGWIEAGGTFLGIEVDASSATAHVGKLVKDLGAPMVSGRYGLGWSASRRGYETVDGGMTWTALDVPEPLVPTRQVTSRACGPIGCTAAGWLRVGWGDAKRPPLPEAPPPARRPATALAPLDLVCDLGPPAPSQGSSASPPGGAALTPLATPRLPPFAQPSMRAGIGLFAPFGTPPMGDLSPFYAASSPTVRADEVAVTAEALDILSRAPRTGPLARLYAWGPKTGDWDKSSRWVARWVSPYGDSTDVHTTTPSTSPFVTIEAARRAIGAPSVPASFASTTAFWTVALGDDPQHALLLGRHPSPVETTLLVVEDGRPIVEARRMDHEPFGDVEAATRVGRRWYVATSAIAGELPATVLWQIDGALAREMARVPRSTGRWVDATTNSESRSDPSAHTATQLARRADGRALGVVVEGQPSDGRYLPSRWVLPVDLETGAMGDPEPLGTTDLSDRPPVTLCQGDEAGWVLDVSWTGAPLRMWNARSAATAASAGSGASSPSEPPASVGAVPMARLHLRRDGACIESVSGSLEPSQLARFEAGGRMPGERTTGRKTVTRREDDSTTAVSVAAASGRVRRALRCVRR